MASDPPTIATRRENERTELKDPGLAAILAWLIPGAGHLYQGRAGKGLLFMVCILGTFFYGLFISEGRAVYASWKPTDMRLPYLCQVGAGLPALPALVQAYRARKHVEPLWGGLMAPPRTDVGFDQSDELAEWNKRLHRYFELGTVYTMIAGLLNILAIYDAFGGPVRMTPDEDPEKKSAAIPPPAT